MSCLVRAREAHHLAMNAFTISSDENAARHLLPSGAEVGDFKAFNNAITVIEWALESQAKRWAKIYFCSVPKKLVDAKNFEAATMAIAELRKYSWTEKTRR